MTKPAATSTPARRARRALRAVAGVMSMIPLIAACAIATPYERIASDRAETDSGSVVVVVTEATLTPDPEARAAFWDGVDNVRAVLAEQPGLVGFSMRQELLGDRAWTMTEWRSEADLEAFVRSPAHERAMAMGSGALADVRFVRLTKPADAGPLEWSELVAALENGRDGYE